MSAAQTAEAVLAHTPAQVRHILLDPLALAQWNPAFTSIAGPPTALTGHRYPITARPGLRGVFTYRAIEPELITTAWQVPGFSEEGTWLIQPVRGGTLVRHSFTHAGPLASILSRAYRGVARLRLERLADRLAST
jgi:hypothetical protein